MKSGKSSYHFVEVMSCKDGCINGGGQPLKASPEDIKARAKLLYDKDEKDVINAAHKNPFIVDLYNNYFNFPNGKKSSEFLHTSFKIRRVLN